MKSTIGLDVLKKQSEGRAKRQRIRCDVCGRFVSCEELISGAATHRMVTPDSDYSREEYETLCPNHKDTP